MLHPKMQYTYVGIDSHKDSHTAVFIDCFFEKLGEITFDNRPSKFQAFLQSAQPFLMDGTSFMFGLEDCAQYGRTLTTFLTENGHDVRHVNAFLVASERKSQNITQKDDNIDAECTARVLLSKFSELPTPTLQDKFWVLRSLVIRRDSLIDTNKRLKNHLHTLLTQHYPNYRSFFSEIDGYTSLAFFMQYPSPNTLRNTTVEALAAFLEIPSHGHIGIAKAQMILDTLENTAVEFQEVRDSAVQSAVRQLQFNLNEIEQLDKNLAYFLPKLDCTLTSMSEIDTVSAAQILSCIGDIKRFPTPAKLARYAGIAPVTYASGKTDLQFANKRGNRELNALLFWLSVRITSTAGRNRKIMNSFFYEYYHRKMSEGKTKRQALKCVQRRLVNIIWTMLTNNEEYVNPPTFDAPPRD